MKRTRHTPEQIVTKLGEADAMLTTSMSIAAALGENPYGASPSIAVRITASFPCCQTSVRTS